MLHWTERFLAQHTLQDPYRILIEAMDLDAAKLMFAVLANCIDFSYSKLHSLIILNPFIISTIHYNLHILSSKTISFF